MAENEVIDAGEKQDILELLQGLPEDADYKIRVYKREGGKRVLLDTLDPPFDVMDLRELYGGGEYHIELTQRGKVVKGGSINIAEKENGEGEPAGEYEERIAALEEKIAELDDTLRNTLEFNHKQLMEAVQKQQPQQQTAAQPQSMDAITQFTKFLEAAKTILVPHQQPPQKGLVEQLGELQALREFLTEDPEIARLHVYKEIITDKDLWGEIKETAALMSGGEGGEKTNTDALQLLRFLGMVKKGIERDTAPEFYVVMLEDQATPEQLDRIKGMGVDGFYEMLEKYKDRLKHLYPTFVTDAAWNWINEFFLLLKATPEERERILSGELEEGEEEIKGIPPKTKPGKKEKEKK